MIFDATSLLHFSIFLLVFEHVTVAAQFFEEMLLPVVDLAAVELLNAVLLMAEAVEDGKKRETALRDRAEAAEKAASGAGGTPHLE